MRVRFIQHRKSFILATKKTFILFTLILYQSSVPHSQHTHRLLRVNCHSLLYRIKQKQFLLSFVCAGERRIGLLLLEFFGNAWGGGRGLRLWGLWRCYFKYGIRNRISSFCNWLCSECCKTYLRQSVLLKICIFMRDANSSSIRRLAVRAIRAVIGVRGAVCITYLWMHNRAAKSSDYMDMILAFFMYASSRICGKVKYAFALKYFSRKHDIFVSPYRP